MRKLEIKEIREKKQRRNEIIIGAILVLIMVISIAGYGFYNTSKGNEENSAEINGVKFYHNGIYWQAQVGDNVFLFMFLPNETGNIKIDFNRKVSDYVNKPLYFVSESPESEIEISRNLARYTPRIQKACISNCSEDLPIKNCSQDNIIIIEKFEKKEISQEENCVYIRSPINESLKTADEFLYYLLDFKKQNLANMPFLV